MGWFVAGLLTGVAIGALGMWAYCEHKKTGATVTLENVGEMTPEEIASLHNEMLQYEAYEADLIRQMRNMLRYDGTGQGQVEKE